MPITYWDLLQGREERFWGPLSKMSTNLSVGQPVVVSFATCSDSDIDGSFAVLRGESDQDRSY